MYVRPVEDVPLHLFPHTPLVNPDPHQPLSKHPRRALLQATEVHPNVGRNGVATP